MAIEHPKDGHRSTERRDAVREVNIFHVRPFATDLSTATNKMRRGDGWLAIVQREVCAQDRRGVPREVARAIEQTSDSKDPNRERICRVSLKRQRGVTNISLSPSSSREVDSLQQSHESVRRQRRLEQEYAEEWKGKSYQLGIE
jgi:hypothetical protein